MDLALNQDQREVEKEAVAEGEAVADEVAAVVEEDGSSTAEVETTGGKAKKKRSSASIPFGSSVLFVCSSITNNCFGCHTRSVLALRVDRESLFSNTHVSVFAGHTLSLSHSFTWHEAESWWPADYSTQKAWLEVTNLHEPLSVVL